MKKKMNNKGFSLVELIVVIAIMAILAVTLAPRLVHYIDKAKGASDQEVANSIYTAVKYACMDENIYNVVKSTKVGIDNASGLTGTNEALYDYDSATFNLINSVYTGSTGTYKIKTFTNSDAKVDVYFTELKTVIGDTIKLKSKLVDQTLDASNNVVPSKIIVKIDSSSKITVIIDYNGNNTYDPATEYQVTE